MPSLRVKAVIVKSIIGSVCTLTFVFVVICFVLGHRHRSAPEGQRGGDGQHETAKRESPPVEEPHAVVSQDERQAYQGQTGKWSDPIVILTGILVVGVFITNAIYWGQLRAMRNTVGLAAAQGDMARRQFDAMKEQAGYMQGQLNVMKEQAVVAKLQARTSADELHRSHRPWVGLVGVPKIESPLTFGHNGCRLRVGYQIRNGSDSPGIGVNLVQSIIISLEENPELPPLRRALGVLAHPNLINPMTAEAGSFLLPQAEFDFAPSEIVIKQDYLNTIPGGSRITLFLLVCVAYRDEFGGVHKTGATFRFVAEGSERSFQPAGRVKGRFENFGMGYAD